MKARTVLLALWLAWMGAAAYGQSSRLPNPALTPGVMRGLTKDVICSTRWGLDRRHVTTSMRRHVLMAYGVPWEKRGNYELDHLIPRELGGADAERNLWPEPWPMAHLKDRVENAAHKAVCNGELGIVEAQRQMAKDWTVLYVRLVGPLPR